jgi:SAM-dependent methyltransferase
MGAVPRTSPLPFESGLTCQFCLFRITTERGIWKALTPERQTHFSQFITEYQIVRAVEGRGSPEAAYYLALPFRDLSGRNQQQWSIRSRTFRYLEHRLLPSFEKLRPRLDILDLGAGNGWLSYRLAHRGHRPVAVDLLTNCSDGLGAGSHYLQKLPTLFPRFQADCDNLPFGSRQFDVAIFNASFHYSEDYGTTLAEVIRCLRPGGFVVIADSPWYRKEESGEQMLQERQSAFIGRFGFASNSIHSREYLTDERLNRLAAQFAIEWHTHRPFYGLAWSLRPLMARVKHRREPSEFRLYVAKVDKP